MLNNKCPNCGGLVNFDISKGQLKCESCDSLFLPEKYESMTGAKEYAENAAYSMSIFTCPNCGGSIASNEMEAVEYCLYCGSFVTLESQIENVRKPDYILPFTKTKEECKKAYAKMISRKLYAPKEFRDPDFMESFKGIYIPYWTYDFECGPDVELDGESESRDGDYLVKQNYSIKCNIDASVEGICYDASSSFDDDISGRLIPFDDEKLVPFKAPYMFGFFADTADISEDVYLEDASEFARDEIWDRVVTDPQVTEGHPVRPSDKKFDSTFKMKSNTYLSMIPIWFLTWRKKDRVAYSVMNGDNGEMYAEIPVDIKRYLLFSLLLAFPIFAVLNLTTFSAASMLKISMVLALMMVFLYTFQLDRIVRKVLHVDDKGYTSVHEDEEEIASKVSDNFVVTLVKCIGSCIKPTGFWGIIIGAIVLFAALEYVIIGGALLIVVAIVYIFFRIGKNRRLLQDHTVWLDVLGSLISLVLSAIMLIADPAGDEFYYFAAIVCIVGVGLSAAMSMRRYNELATRPLPRFFEREAGGEN